MSNKLRLTAAAKANVDETGIDPRDDIAALRKAIATGRGDSARYALLDRCLDGADKDRVEGWHEYLYAVWDVAQHVQRSAYEIGYSEGRAWDLDGFDADQPLPRDGWDSSTIDALGSDKFAEWLDVPSEGPLWKQACADYARGAYAGATEPQEHRSGLPPRGRQSAD